MLTTDYFSSTCLTEHPLLRQHPGSLWSPAVVLSYAEPCLSQSFTDGSPTQLYQLHKAVHGWLGVLTHKHGWLIMEEILLVLARRQVPLKTTDLRAHTQSYCTCLGLFTLLSLILWNILQ